MITFGVWQISEWVGDNWIRFKHKDGIAQAKWYIEDSVGEELYWCEHGPELGIYGISRLGRCFRIQWEEHNV